VVTGVTRVKIVTMCWSAALAVALLWPSHVLSVVDGMPLDGAIEAVAIGIVVPILWWTHRRFLDGRIPRVLIVALLALKGAAAVLLAQQGLCARFTTSAPFHAEVLTIPIDEPRGFLRSWDVRAGWRSSEPGCTAIVARGYPTAASFPAWFLNITDFATGGRRSLALDVTGFVRVASAGTFALELDRDMSVTGRIGEQTVASAAGTAMSVPLAAGVHHLDIHAQLTGDRWKFIPLWNGRDAFAATGLTIGDPGPAEQAATAAAAVMVALVAALIGSWIWSALASQRKNAWAIVWCAVATLLLAAAGVNGRFERLAGPFLFAAAMVPVAQPQRNLRGACLLLGVPWLAFFAARALPLVGHFSAYSSDDWLAYQVAGYRIYMNGFWLEGGSRMFDYQPLYRWISGLLHLVFGDSSVGETYFDAACLLAGALLAYQLTSRSVGFRAGIVAGAATLATFTLGTIWYFVGRGLSEIAASGFASVAVLLLLRARLGRIASAAAAGMCATLMFYTRLNHLLFALCLPALLWPLRTAARARDWLHAARVVRVKAVVVYGIAFAAGTIAFASRTWWYAGVFSLWAGTSLQNNDTGLRLATIASPLVWRAVGHSVSALVWMNEPPRPDPRALFVVVGVVLAALAVVQVPRVNRLPAPIAIVCLAAMASSFFVHTHNYPGRMTIHLVPFAAAMTIIGATRAVAAAQSALARQSSASGPVRYVVLASERLSARGRRP
jgi:hypothetical protein